MTGEDDLDSAADAARRLRTHRAEEGCAVPPAPPGCRLGRSLLRRHINVRPSLGSGVLHGGVSETYAFVL